MKTNQLESLIKEVTGVEPFDKSRKLSYVFARAIFYKILYNKFKYTKTDISRRANKNHGTIIHALKHFDVWLKHNKRLKYWYDSVIIMMDYDINYIDPNDLYQKMIYLQEENERLKTKNKKLKQKLNEKTNDKNFISGNL